MEHAVRKIVLKGRASGVLFIEGGSSAAVRIEWLKGSERGPVLLFSAPDAFCVMESTKADIPAKSVIAAAVGEDMAVRGQLAPFDWKKASACVAMKRYIADIKENPPELVDDTMRESEENVVAENEQPGDEIRDETTEVSEKQVSEGCPLRQTPVETSAFSNAFPGSVWYEHEYASTGRKRRYLTGMIYKNGKAVRSAVAVPGKPGSAPPPWLKDFTSFAVDDDLTGYWIMFSPVSDTKY